MIKKIYYLLICSFIIPLSIYAQKEGKIKMGEFASYKGMVTDNQPIGEGVLSYKWKSSNFVVKLIDKISGTFNGNIVENANVTFAVKNCSYKGILSYYINSENGQLKILLKKGILTINGKEYPIKNQEYAADGKQSSCQFGKKNEEHFSTTELTVDKTAKKRATIIVGQDKLAKIRGIKSETQATIPSSIIISTKTDDITGVRYLDVDETSANRNNRRRIVSDDGAFTVRPNYISYTTPDKNITICYKGYTEYQLSDDRFGLDDNDVCKMVSPMIYGIKKRFANGTLVTLTLEDGKNNYSGTIEYINGDIQKGEFIITSNSSYNFIEEVIENSNVNNYHLINGVIKKADGTTIVQNTNSYWNNRLKNEIAICDSLWNSQITKEGNLLAKKYLAGHIFEFTAKTDGANEMIISANFLDESKIVIKAGWFPIKAVKNMDMSKKQNIALTAMLANSFKESYEFEGEYSIIKGLIILRRDFKHYVTNSPGRNAKELFEWYGEYKKEERKKIKGFVGTGNYQQIKALFNGEKASTTLVKIK